MSYDDAEILGGHNICYDEYLDEINACTSLDGITDVHLLHDNRSTRYGEPRDTLWPLSNFRGGWDNEGSGPHVSYSSQIGSPINHIPPGRNIEWDRNADRDSPDLPLSDILKSKKEKLQEKVQNDVLSLLNLHESVQKRKEKLEETSSGSSAGSAANTTTAKTSFWAGQSTTTWLLVLVFILMVATIAVQHLHTRRLTDILQMVLQNSSK